MAKILVAASPEPRAVVERALLGHELSCVETLAQAEELLSRRTFDLIVCTIIFDGSRMFDFLRRVKSTPEWRRIPFVCARVVAHIVRSPSAAKAAAFTCRAMGGDAFLDVADYHVDPEREWRDAVERLLATSPPGGSVTTGDGMES